MVTEQSEEIWKVIIYQFHFLKFYFPQTQYEKK